MRSRKASAALVTAAGKGTTGAAAETASSRRLWSVLTCALKRGAGRHDDIGLGTRWHSSTLQEIHVSSFLGPEKVHTHKFNEPGRPALVTTPVR